MIIQLIMYKHRKHIMYDILVCPLEQSVSLSSSSTTCTVLLCCYSFVQIFFAAFKDGSVVCYPHHYNRQYNRQLARGRFCEKHGMKYQTAPTIRIYVKSNSKWRVLKEVNRDGKQAIASSKKRSMVR